MSLGLALPLAGGGGGESGGTSTPVGSTPVVIRSSSVRVLVSASSSISSTPSSNLSNASAASATVNQNVGFVLPFDDKASCITQVGVLLNHMPAGKFGFIKVDANGHFAAGSERERFLGRQYYCRVCYVFT
jgi:hypothetical protein